MSSSTCSAWVRLCHDRQYSLLPELKRWVWPSRGRMDLDATKAVQDPGRLRTPLPRAARGAVDGGLVRAGSVAPRHNYCGKANCRCHGDPPEPHGPYLQWTAKVDGKTVNRRLRPEEAELFREWIANERRLRAMLDELHALAAVATDLIIEKGRRARAGGLIASLEPAGYPGGSDQVPGEVGSALFTSGSLWL